MTDYTINDLRTDLAGTIKALRDGDEKMSIEKAKAISEIAQTIINSAKVEVEMLKTVGRGRMTPTGFVPLENKDTLDLQQQEGTGREAPQLASPNGQAKPKPHIREPMGSSPRAAI